MMEHAKKDKKERKAKKDHKKKRKEKSIVAEEAETPDSTKIDKKKNDLKKKNEDRKRPRDLDDHEEQTRAAEEDDGDDGSIDRSDKKTSKSNEKDGDKDKTDRKESRKRRREEKENLLKQVPTVDEHGISYTKIQIRRMLKRVKKGLSPVPSREELELLKRQERELRKEEEAELAGLFYKKDDDFQKGPASGKSDREDEESGHSGDDDDGEDSDGEAVDGNNVSDEDADKLKPKGDGDDKISAISPSEKKKTRRSKPVPKDYVCQACQNKHEPAHWIYDCVDKKYVKGANQKSKKFRGLHDPDSKKVFVSGLPFDVKNKDVEQMFASCGTVRGCKLIKFDDTGRCKGQAYISFETEESAKQAIKLSGTTIDNSHDDDKKKDKKKKDSKNSDSKRAKLTLKVSRVLNRRSTSKNTK